MEFTSRLEKFSSELWGHHISVPAEAVKKFVDGENRRVICTLNGREKYHCALMPGGENGWFINVNKQIREKLNLQLGDAVDVFLRKDRSEYGLPMPEELEEMLYQDEEGSYFFHALTKGKQRSLIYWCSNVKSSHIKLRRALVLMNHLKNYQGNLDFKQLHEELKNANRQGL